MIFDTHAHYDDEAFKDDCDEMLLSMNTNNVGKIVNVGAHLAGSQRSIDLANKYPFVYAAIGVHPDDADEVDEEGIAKLEKMTHNEKVVAVGEIGLDYYWHKDNYEIQQRAFKEQIELARKCGLPIIIHSRDAAADTMRILKENDAGVNGGVVHCFSYSPEIAKEAIDMGFNIGVGGVVTFNNAKKLKEVVESIPLEKIVLETDCPYLAPVPFRGQRNSSLYLPYVTEAIAVIKKVSTKEVEDVTYENACRMYGIK